MSDIEKDVNENIDEVSGALQIDLNLSEEMRSDYLDYACSVIKSRALPDVRDGFKPVHRRILYAMHGLGVFPNSNYKKSARIVGDTMGKYHPHGDSSIYEAAVKMAQDWTKRVLLIDGQGNFGSMDGDSAAAMRYTEMRLATASYSFFKDIDKDIINFIPNYDGTEKEPEVLPVSFPNLLVNGVDGIAVGMATYILPHNLGEVIDATLALQENPQLSVDELIKIIPGPDLPTGGTVYNLDGFREALLTGYGSVKVRSKWHTETLKDGREIIVVDELPYQIVKSELVEKIKDLVKSKNKMKIKEYSPLDEITGVNDLSSKDGIRIVISLRKDAVPAVVFNHLVQKTKIQESYGYNMIVLDGKTPKLMNFYQIVEKFLLFRTEVIERRTRFLLERNQKRLHILKGFMKVINRLKEAVELIMSHKNVADARAELMERFDLDEIQASEILEMKIQRLTGMELDKITNDHNDVQAEVYNLLDILAKPERVKQIIREDLLDARKRFNEPRKTEISYESSNISMADIVKKENCLIHITEKGYIKRTSVNEIEAQNRNGKGRLGIKSDDDFVKSIYSGSTHDLFIAFTKSGKAFATRVWNLQDGNLSSKGRHIRNIFENLDDEIASVVLVPEILKGHSLITVTEKGRVKRTNLESYNGSTRRNGLKGVSIEEGDRLVSVLLAKEYDHLILVSSKGKATRFSIDSDILAEKGRGSMGVRGIRVPEDAIVIGAMVIESNGKPLPQIPVTINVEKDEQIVNETVYEDDTSEIDEGKFLLCVGENGVGKRTAISEFTARSRGTKGVNCFNINEKTGDLIKAAIVHEDEDIILTTEVKTLRINVADIRSTGRGASGSLLMNVDEDKIVDLVVVPVEKEEEVEENYESLENEFEFTEIENKGE